MSWLRRLFGQKETPVQDQPKKQIGGFQRGTQPTAQGTSDRGMADLQIHCSLPDVAKRLTPCQIEELVQAMLFCAWNGIHDKLGDLVSNPSVQAYGSDIIFKLSVPADQELRTGQEVQSLWDNLQKLVERPISSIASSPMEGVHLFLMQYRDGNYGADARDRSNVKYRLVSGDDAKVKAKAVRPLEFSEGKQYAIAINAPVTFVWRLHWAEQREQLSALPTVWKAHLHFSRNS